MPRLDSSHPVESLDPLEHFTGRRKARARVRKLTKVSRSEDLRVLAFWGVAGIGKSALLSKVTEDLHEMLPVAKCSLRDLKGVLIERETLIHLHGLFEGVDFSQFNLCLSAILHAEGQEVPRLLNARPGFLLAWAITTDLPTGGTAGKAINYLEQLTKSKPRVRDFVRKVGGTCEVIGLVARARAQDPSLQEELTRLFVEGLRTSQAPPEGAACRAVILLDHYESLWSSEKPGAGGPGELVDEWVRQLAGYCLGAGILLVIASRDELLWPSWEESDFEQYCLKGLSERDSRILLSNRGIENPPENYRDAARPLQDAILSISQTDTGQGRRTCHPLFLNLCADIVLNNRNKGIADDPSLFFSSGQLDDPLQTLAKCFLSSLQSRTVASWLKDLALTPRFDEKAALVLDDFRQYYCGRASLNQLLTYSFVEEITDGWYKLHPLFRTTLLNLTDRASPIEAETIHIWFQEYWNKRGEYSIQWSHSFSLSPEATLYHWLELHREKMANRDYSGARTLFDLWRDIKIDARARAKLGNVTWAFVHASLGHAALVGPTGPTSTILYTAIDHISAALEVYTYKANRLKWAAAQTGLGTALGTLGEREEGTKRLEQAEKAFRNALNVYHHEVLPNEIAETQQNLGVVLMCRGERKKGTEQLKLAVNAFHKALTILERKSDQWATTKHNLGATYGIIGTRERDVEKLEKGKAAFLEALKVRTPTKNSALWAATQHNLGTVLLSLGEMEDGIQSLEHLEHSETAFNEALKVRTRDSTPVDWATTQNNLGCTLRRIAERNGDVEKLQESLTAHRNALDIFSRAVFSIDWAATQNNLGASLLVLGNSEKDPKWLEQAEVAFRLALEVYTQNETPVAWEQAQKNLKLTLESLRSLKGK